jgi:NAD(P)-dependent dehydrogenase (short-subunit alcohol dehydrogenase family)
MAMAEGTFDGQRVCIVGGTAGIGLAIAQSLARDGANVIIVGRDADKAQRVARGIGSGVEGRGADATDGAAIKALFDAIGAIDHLVVTAAQVRGGMFRDGPLADARFTMEGKFWSQYLCARHAQVRGSILLFSGTLSRKPMVGTSIIGAVNGAIEALGRSLAVELAPVRVNVIAPGLVRDTDAYAGMPKDAVAAMVAEASSKLPVRLVGDGAAVAGMACAVLASPYVTGAVIDVDGGGLLV